MPTSTPIRLRVAAIDFLNPAPLLYNFTHDPAAPYLGTRYDFHYTSPANCAVQLATGEADLGLIPIAALAHLPQLTAVPGCTIASLREVRSIQLVLKPGVSLNQIQIIAADSASRSSIAYLQTILRAFYDTNPTITTLPANLPTMLQKADAALLIGDPALLALETRSQYPHHTWIDLATLWNDHTQLPWVAAVWAVHPQALLQTETTPTRLIEDLSKSRDAGLTHLDTLIADWTPRIAIPPAIIRTYLTQNIHYDLDPACLQAIAHFYDLAASTDTLPQYTLRTLET